jgi:outer membrane protein OmpA-like peptidoglycan-associated protein
MRLMIIVILLMFYQLKGFSQNLVINGNFNDINICSEFHAPCSFEAWRLTSSLLPENLNEGINNFTSITVFNPSVRNVRGYLESRLGDKLHIGEKYKFSIDVKSSNIFINNIGVYFSDTLVLSSPDCFLKLKPQIVFVNNKSLLQNKKGRNWLRLESEITATSEARFIIIGCFLNDNDLRYKFKKGEYKEYTNYKYNIDNVSLKPLDSHHDTTEIHNIKDRLYSQDYRHPVPDSLLVWNDKQIFLEKFNELGKLSDTIQLYNDLLFEFNSFKPSKYLINKIDSVFRRLSTNKDSVIIIGHTDNIGTDSYNETLSYKRAESISNYIISKDFIPSNKIEISGKGSRYPIDTNDTENGRYKNRRVEIIIKYKSAP